MLVMKVCINSTGGNSPLFEYHQSNMIKLCALSEFPIGYAGF